MDNLMTDVQAILRFLWAGNAVFTLVSPTGKRFTYKVSRIKPGRKNAGSYRIKLMTGPDNMNSYTGLGWTAPDHANFVRWNNLEPNLHKGAEGFEWLLTRLTRPQPLNQVQLFHEGRCGRCGRRLTVPESITSGIGPECAGKL